MYRRQFLVSLTLAGPLLRNVAHAATGSPAPRRPDRDYADDIFVDSSDRADFAALLQRLKLVRSEAGFGRFKLMGIGEAKLLARARRHIGGFTRRELALFEKLFYQDAADYGFQGERVLDDAAYRIAAKKAVKIAGSGNYLFRGAPQQLFLRIRADVGETVILTSGIRGVLMQTLIFMDRAMKLGGNLSRVSRTIAPPAYSWHAVGDFDIGVAGLGDDNFTLRLTRTREYRQIMKLDYVSVRYPRNNSLGVRYEPWHIKAVPSAASSGQGA